MGQGEEVKVRSEPLIEIQSLHIEREGSFLLQIKNPEQQHQQGEDGGGGGGGAGFRGIQNKRKTLFPAHLQGQLDGKRFCPADPPDFLNYKGYEFLLISASDDIQEELGLELKTKEQKEGQRQEAEQAANDHQEDPPFCSSSSCSDLVKTFGEDVAPTTPLFEGTWA